MKRILLLLSGLLLIWVQTSAIQTFSVWGVKPNLLLMGVILSAMRWISPGMLVFACLAGLSQDAYSHGMLGVYGLSFLGTAGLAYVGGRSFFENNWLFIALLVSLLTLAEGLMALAILRVVEGQIPVMGWFFHLTLPVALYNGVLTFPALWLLTRLARLVERD
ncbi:MAG: rod shape-determining protein MreD [Deltaproteobacteria bacterium]|nr:rod shape-determining protein MreD [Deltaproteobacteria bacterium]MDH4122000.1 rod shape-determining protein MreD [Deltaproteobacteria bacterium]